MADNTFYDPEDQVAEIYDPEAYDSSFDFEETQLSEKDQKALDFDPTKIDFMNFDPDSITCEIQALKILKYLRGMDRSDIEDMTYQVIMENFGIEEADPTTLTKEEKKQVASSFKMFVRYMFMVENGFKFDCNWHHDYICDTLERLFLGMTTCPRIVLNIPPRYSKTQLLIYFVSWTLGFVPDSEYIWIGYAKRLSEESSQKIREVLQNEKYMSIFPCRINSSSKAKDNFKTTKRGVVYATSTGGTLTGKGAGKKRKSWGGCIILDDGNNTTDAFSATQRDKANNWVANTLLSRRNNRKLTPIINIQQRVHANDISGYLLPTEERALGYTGEEWTHINIPAILTKADLERLEVPEDSETVKQGDPKADEYPLWPTSHTLEELRNMQENLPTLTFFGQYMQQPYASDGSIIKQSWILPRSKPKESEIKYRVFVCDTAQTKTNRADWSVIMVACVLTENKGVFIEHIHREKLEAPDLVEQILEYYRIYRPINIYIEYKSSGINTVQYLKREKLPLPVTAIPRNASAGDGDSLVRASSVATWIKCGYVTYQENAPWASTFFKEITMFPTGEHDDQVDTLVDLVSKEVVKDGNTLMPMNLNNLPIKDGTFEEDVEKNPDNSLSEMVSILENGDEIRVGRRVIPSDEPEWTTLLLA